MEKKSKLYYVVANGRQVGVFDTWDECNASVRGYPNGVYKSFKTITDVEDYCKQQAGRFPAVKDAINKYRQTLQMTDEDSATSSQSYNADEDSFISLTDENIKNITHRPSVNVFTDGSCDSNGTSYAKAAIGVYCTITSNRGVAEYMSISERVPSVMPQTNNSAELHAIVRALEIIPADLNITVFTDSQYCVDILQGRMYELKSQQWPKSVANVDTIRYVCFLWDLRKGDKRVEKVKGHSKHEGNTRAHNMAVKALDISVATVYQYKYQMPQDY